jgi:tyrosine-specific transport protein
MTHLKNHLFGSILLIAGCSVGGGIIGLPIITSVAGFLPSSLALLVAWALMTSTGLLLAEVYLWSSDEVSLVTMAQRSVGKIGALIAWVFFLFLFVSLLVAYVSASGSILHDMFERLGLNTSPYLLATVLTALVGFFLFLGREATDGMNRILMIGLVLTYILLVALSWAEISTENLSYRNWDKALFIMPVFIVSFGYHNLVPTISGYLNRDKKKIRLGIILGTLIPFIIYFIWEGVFLGSIPIQGFQKAIENGTRASQLLDGKIAEVFVFLAIVTSFLAVALSLIDFLADGLHLPANKKRNRFILLLLTLLPPLFFGISNPRLFLTGLQLAGGIGAMILYGVLPVWMVWRGRYHLGKKGQELLPIGKGGLLVILALSVGIIILTIAQEFGAV